MSKDELTIFVKYLKSVTNCFVVALSRIQIYYKICSQDTCMDEANNVKCFFDHRKIKHKVFSNILIQTSNIH